MLMAGREDDGLQLEAARTSVGVNTGSLPLAPVAAAA